MGGLWSSVVHGIAVAGGAFVALATANGVGIQVPQLQLKQLLIVLGVAGLKSMFDYLQDNPAPKAEDDTDPPVARSGTTLTRK